MTRKELKVYWRQKHTHLSLLFVFSSNSPIRMLFIGWNYTQICFRGAWQQQKLVWSLTLLFFSLERIPINRLSFSTFKIFVFYPVGFSPRCTLNETNSLRSFYTNHKFPVGFQWEKSSRHHRLPSSHTTIQPLHCARILEPHWAGQKDSFLAAACHWAIMLLTTNQMTLSFYAVKEPQCSKALVIYQ